MIHHLQMLFFCTDANAAVVVLSVHVVASGSSLDTSASLPKRLQQMQWSDVTAVAVENEIEDVLSLLFFFF